MSLAHLIILAWPGGLHANPWRWPGTFAHTNPKKVAWARELQLKMLVRILAQELCNFVVLLAFWGGGRTQETKLELSGASPEKYNTNK